MTKRTLQLKTDGKKKAEVRLFSFRDQPILERTVQLEGTLEVEIEEPHVVVHGKDRETGLTEIALADLRKNQRFEHKFKFAIPPGQQKLMDREAGPSSVLEAIREAEVIEDWLLVHAKPLLLLSTYFRESDRLGEPLKRGRDGEPEIESLGADGGRIIRCQNGVVVLSERHGTYSIHGPIYEKWLAGGAEKGVGYPISPERACADGKGRHQSFLTAGSRPSNACSIYWSPDTPACFVVSMVRLAYQDQGAAAGPLGYPTEDLARLEHYDTQWFVRRQAFQRGFFFESAHKDILGAHALHGPLLDAWRSFGADRVIGLKEEDIGPGAPVSDVVQDGDALVQHFIRYSGYTTGWNATLCVRDGKSFYVWGKLRDVWWNQRGGGRGAWGWPRGAQVMKDGWLEVEFERCRVKWQAYGDNVQVVQPPATAPAQPQYMLHQLDVTKTFGAGERWYERSISGSYVDLYWPGVVAGKENQTLMLIPPAAYTTMMLGGLVDPSQLPLLQPRTSLGSRFSELFGTGASVFIRAIPSTPQGVSLTDVASIGIGLMPRR